MQCVHPMLRTMLSQVLLVYLLLCSKYVSPSMHFNFHPHQNMYLHVLLQPHKYVLSPTPSMKFALHHCVAHVIFKNKEASGVISISHLHLALGKKAQLASLTRFDSI